MTYNDQIQLTISILRERAAAIGFPTIVGDLPTPEELAFFHKASSEQMPFINQEAVLYAMARLLDEVLPQSFKPLDEILDKGFWLAKCTKCYWWGSSRLLLGGGRDYWGEVDDCYCPVCGSWEVDEVEDTAIIEEVKNEARNE